MALYFNTLFYFTDQVVESIMKFELEMAKDKSVATYFSLQFEHFLGKSEGITKT
jgi:hypothetical protein